MIIYETSVIKVTCDQWGRWTVYYKSLDETSELENVAKAVAIIELERIIWNRDTRKWESVD